MVVVGVEGKGDSEVEKGYERLYSLHHVAAPFPSDSPALLDSWLSCG